MVELTDEHRLIDIPALNRFRIGDKVIVDASADNDSFEGVIIGIELQRDCGQFVPCITLLEGGYITDGFKPDDCRKVEADVVLQATVNFNDRVLVRLTEDGHRILKERHEEMRQKLPSYPSYVPRKTNDEGQVSFQIWDLMNTFGPYMHLGSTKLPIEASLTFPSLSAKEPSA